MSLVGKHAPPIQAYSYDKGNIEYTTINFTESPRELTLLFFYPKDFTFVCPTELVELNNNYNEFVHRRTKIYTLSTDSAESHRDWDNTPINKGGLGGVQYPMLSDPKAYITDIYGVKHVEEDIALRATFLVDNNGIVVYESIHDLPIGRNIQEILRVIDGYRYSRDNGDVCPVNWQPNDLSMKPTKEGLNKYLKDIEEFKERISTVYT